MQNESPCRWNVEVSEGPRGPPPESEAGASSSACSEIRLHRRITLVIQLIILLGLMLFLLQGNWLNSVVVSGISLLTLLPVLAKSRFNVFIPPEFELVAVLFIFLSLFLGEVHGYYGRFLWWDKLLHLGSGFLLGVLGFVLVFVLNEYKHVDLHLSSRFVALFAFAFAVALGAVWEIFEFSVDPLFGLNMKEARLGGHHAGSDRGYHWRGLDLGFRLSLNENRHGVVPGAMDRSFYGVKPGVLQKGPLLTLIRHISEGEVP